MSRPAEKAGERAVYLAIKEGIQSKDFGSIADAFFKYGMYLLLIGGDTKVKGIQTFTAGGVKR